MAGRRAVVWTDVLSLVTLLGQGGKPQDPPFWLQILPFVLILSLLFPIVIWPQRREQKKRDELMNSLKKNDRVVTIGGMIGSIANISPDGKEITLKVDDNCRIRFTRAAIVSKLEESKDDATRTAV